jgi:hypothetical protein
MKRLRIGLMIMLAACCAPVLEREAKAQAETRFNYARLSLTMYLEWRLGYQSLPVRVEGAGGGKLGANEPFKVFATALKNTTARNVSAVKLGYFIFKTRELTEVLDKAETALIQIDLHANETRKVMIHVFNFEDSPLFKNNSGDEYRIEVAVTEVHYDDGTIWRGTELPQKIDPARLPCILEQRLCS